MSMREDWSKSRKNMVLVAFSDIYPLIKDTLSEYVLAILKTSLYDLQLEPHQSLGSIANRLGVTPLFHKQNDRPCVTFYKSDQKIGDYWPNDFIFTDVNDNVFRIDNYLQLVQWLDPHATKHN